MSDSIADSGATMENPDRDQNEAMKTRRSRLWIARDVISSLAIVLSFRIVGRAEGEHVAVLLIRAVCAFGAATAVGAQGE